MYIRLARKVKIFKKLRELLKLKELFSGGHWGGGGRGANGGASLPLDPIIFTEALVLKSGSTRKFSFQEVKPLLII